MIRWWAIHGAFLEQLNMSGVLLNYCDCPYIEIRNRGVCSHVEQLLHIVDIVSIVDCIQKWSR